MMNEQEMTTEEILSSIRQMLSDEVRQGEPAESVPVISEITDVFVLTQEMRCPPEDILKEKMQRVLEKMSQQKPESSSQILNSNWKV